MAEVKATPRLGISINFDINEQEARALDALAGYGDDAFIQAFKEKLGEAYLRNHENGLRTFLRSIREVVREGLATLDKSRQLFREYEEEIRMQRAEKAKRDVRL